MSLIITQKKCLSKKNCNLRFRIFMQKYSQVSVYTSQIKYTIQHVNPIIFLF